MYFLLCYHFEISTAGTACASLETGSGTGCEPCFRCGSSEVPRIPQGISTVPIPMVLGLAIQAQNVIKIKK